MARLSDYGADHDDATRQAVTGLGLKYELLTAYTSFVAVHEKVRNQGGDAKDVDQPLPLPEGVSDSAVGVPEPELPVLIALGTLLLSLTAVARVRTRRASR